MMLLLLSFSSLLALVAAVPATTAAGPIGTTFLYHVWGIGISGLPVFYDNGALLMNCDGPSSLLLELTNPPRRRRRHRLRHRQDETQPHASDMSVSCVPVVEHSQSLTTPQVTFTERQQPPPGKKGLGNSLTATPDLAKLTSPATFESAMLFVSDRSSWESHAVGFTTTENAAAEGKKVGGFVEAGWRFHLIEDSTQSGYMSVFCAFPSAESPGVWDLRWNVTNDVPERADGRPVFLSSKPFTALGPVDGSTTWTKCRTQA